MFVIRSILEICKNNIVLLISVYIFLTQDYCNN